MQGDCRTLELTEGKLEQILAAYSYRDKIVNSIQFVKGGETVSYGPYYTDAQAEQAYYLQVEQFDFTDGVELLGLYGYETDEGISQLGFITLDQTCVDNT